MDETVLSETSDRVSTITLNRPEARNAMNSELQRALAIALAGAEADEGVDVVILTGADPAFCAGLDLRELGSTAANLVGGRDDEHRSPLNGALDHDEAGHRRGQRPCRDRRLRARARMRLPGGIGARHVRRHARARRRHAGRWDERFPPPDRRAPQAKEMSLTGNFIDAREALEFRLVNHVVAHEELLPAARGLATDIAGNDQQAVRNLKQLYDRGSKLSVGDAIALEQERFGNFRVDPSEIERRRTAVVQRGRGQTK
jgi:enoyl-CoA hydratase